MPTPFRIQRGELRSLFMSHYLVTPHFTKALENFRDSQLSFLRDLSAWCTDHKGQITLRGLVDPSSQQRYGQPFGREAVAYEAALTQFATDWGLLSEWAHEYLHSLLVRQFIASGIQDTNWLEDNQLDMVIGQVKDSGIPAYVWASQEWVLDVNKPEIRLEEDWSTLTTWPAFQQAVLIQARSLWVEHMAEMDRISDWVNIGPKGTRDAHWLYLKCCPTASGKRRSWHDLATEIGEAEGKIRKPIYSMADMLQMERRALGST